MALQLDPEYHKLAINDWEQIAFDLCEITSLHSFVEGWATHHLHSTYLKRFYILIVSFLGIQLPCSAINDSKKRTSKIDQDSIAYIVKIKFVVII